MMPLAIVWSLTWLVSSALPRELTPPLSALSMDNFWGPLADCSHQAMETATTLLAMARLELTAAFLSVTPVSVYLQVEPP